jgi:hypothetical protein
VLPAQLSNRHLRRSHLPAPGATWENIQRFALTFAKFVDWDDMFGRREARFPGPDAPLTDFRTALFFQQRAWRHQGVDPPPEGMVYVHWLVEEIRRKFG